MLRVKVRGGQSPLVRHCSRAARSVIFDANVRRALARCGADRDRLVPTRERDTAGEVPPVDDRLRIVWYRQRDCVAPGWAGTE